MSYINNEFSIFWYFICFADAQKVKDMLNKVDQELKYVERECIDLKSNKYLEMIGAIYQETMHEEKAKELKEIGIYIC